MADSTSPTSSPNPSSSNQSLGVPIAIVLAGGLIALSIYFGGGGGKTQPAASPASGGKLDLAKIAKAAGVGNARQFEECVSSGKYASRVADDLKDAEVAGGQGTPYSVVLTSDGRKIPVSGAVPYTSLQQTVTLALAPPGPASPSPSPLPGQEVPPIGDIRPVSDTDHIRGNRQAQLTVIEYSDVSCPFCKRFHPTMQQLMAEYPNDVRWVYRHFPLSQIHPYAQEEAQAAECAGEQGKFWEMIDAMYAAKP